MKKASRVQMQAVNVLIVIALIALFIYMKTSDKKHWTVWQKSSAGNSFKVQELYKAMKKSGIRCRLRTQRPPKSQSLFDSNQELLPVMILEVHHRDEAAARKNFGPPVIEESVPD